MGDFLTNKVAVATITVSTLAIGIILVANNIKCENNYAIVNLEEKALELIEDEPTQQEINTYFLEQRAIDNSSENELPNYIIGKINSENSVKVHDIIHIVVAGEYTIEGLKKIAEKEMELYTAKSNIDTLTIGFYEKLNQIGHGYEMGYIEYSLEDEDVLSNYNIVNKLKFPIEQSKEDLDIKSIKKQIEQKFKESNVEIEKDGVFLRAKIEENDTDKILNEFTIAKYTDIVLEHKLEDIEYIEIEIKSDEKCIRAILNMKAIQEQNGKYFDIDYIRNNIK